ncbi:MAG: hypothetical protein ACSHXY_03040 [Alphaproteobacteria bacterium]
MLGGVASVALLDDGPVVGILLTLMGAAISGFMAPSLSSVHDVTWTDDEIVGACKMFGPTLGRNRTCIKWDEISGFGTTATSYWYMQTNDRRRIYWSYLY